MKDREIIIITLALKELGFSGFKIESIIMSNVVSGKLTIEQIEGLLEMGFTLSKLNNGKESTTKVVFTPSKS